MVNCTNIINNFPLDKIPGTCNALFRMILINDKPHTRVKYVFFTSLIESVSQQITGIKAKSLNIQESAICNSTDNLEILLPV